MERTLYAMVQVFFQATVELYMYSTVYVFVANTQQLMYTS